MPEPQDAARRAIADDASVTSPTELSTASRVVAFAAILAAGAAGGFIGYAITELQCTGDCTVAVGIGGLLGAVFAAVGVAIVVQLALRAMSEWRSVQARGGPVPVGRVPDARLTTDRPRPRVQ